MFHENCADDNQSQWRNGFCKSKVNILVAGKWSRLQWTNDGHTLYNGKDRVRLVPLIKKKNATQACSSPLTPRAKERS